MRYAVYGLTIESAFALDTLPSPEGDGPADVRLLRAPSGTFTGFDASASPTTWYRRELLADGSVYLAIPDVLQAIISADGRTARCAPAPDGDPRAFEANVLNFVATAALTLQGEEPLHATVVRLAGRTVGFLGDSGAGKSTLAAFLLAEGAELVTDDMLRVAYDGGEATAYRGPPRLKLLDEQARLLLPAAARDAAFNPMSGKLLVEALSSRDDRFPLSALFWLDEVPAEAVSVRLVQGAETIRILLASTLHRDHRPPERIACQLRALERLAKSVPLFALAYPRRHELLPAVADAVRRSR
ncbi:MAG: hypothetical protein ACHQPH_19250 [Reyranellales bacterium]|jgi:hypothetical protein